MNCYLFAAAASGNSKGQTKKLSKVYTKISDVNASLDSRNQIKDKPILNEHILYLFIAISKMRAHVVEDFFPVSKNNLLYSFSRNTRYSIRQQIRMKAIICIIMKYFLI